MKIKKLLVIFFCVVAIGLGFYFSTNTSFLTSTATPSPTPRTSAQKPPLEIFNEEKVVTFQATAFPTEQSTLPIYSLTPATISLTNALLISNTLGFTNKPLKTPKTPSTYRWENNGATLVFREDKNSELLSFSQPNFSLVSNPITNAIEGMKFLTSFFPISASTCSFSLEKTNSGPFDGISYAGSLTGYYYTCLTPNKYPISSVSFGTTFATIITRADGKIYSFSLLSPYSLSESNKKEILTPKEAVFNIQKGNGVLFFVSKNGLFSFFEESPQFTNVNFLSYSFYYYPNSNGSLLEPYYVFEGEAISTDGEQLLVKYALPALIKN